MLINIRGEEMMDGENGIRKRWFVVVPVALIALVLLIMSCQIVPAGHNGVVFNIGQGIKPVPLDEGFHFITPFVESVTMMETRTQLVEGEAAAASKDLQVVETKIALNFKPEYSITPQLYKEIGMDYKTRIINPAIQEAVKAVTAKYNAEEMITQRDLVKQEIKAGLVARLSVRGITVVDISIVNFDFSAQFNAAIESKVTAEQDTLKATRVLDRVKIEKQQSITQAEAIAESMKIDADAQAYKRTVEAEAEATAMRLIRNELELSRDLIEYKAIEKWDGSLPQVSSGAVPFIDVARYQEGQG